MLVELTKKKCKRAKKKNLKKHEMFYGWQLWQFYMKWSRNNYDIVLLTKSMMN